MSLIILDLTDLDKMLVNEMEDALCKEDEVLFNHEGNFMDIHIPNKKNAYLKTRVDLSLICDRYGLELDNLITLEHY